MDFPEQLRVIRKISEGHFGEVYLCENTCVNSRKEAVKVIKSKDSDPLKNFNRNIFESSALEYLKQCQYIIDIYDAQIDKEKNFVIRMEYIENGSVQGLLDKAPFLSIRKCAKIAGCILNALEYAHARKILHLDIKPANILIGNNDIYKLSDFGLSGIKDADGSCEFELIYNLHYPPEKMSNINNKATEQSDIYMFGITMYRMLNGDSYTISQFERTEKINEAIMKGVLPDRKNYIPHVPQKIKRIINKCMHPSPRKRYKSVREIKHDLSRLKMNYIWIPKNISPNFYNWEYSYNGTTIGELECEKNTQGSWNINLYKFGKTKKIRVTTHCHNNLSYKNFAKKVGEIFNEYF